MFAANRCHEARQAFRGQLVDEVRLVGSTIVVSLLPLGGLIAIPWPWRFVDTDPPTLESAASIGELSTVLETNMLRATVERMAHETRAHLIMIDRLQSQVRELAHPALALGDADDLCRQPHCRRPRREHVAVSVQKTTTGLMPTSVDLLVCPASLYAAPA